MEARRPIYERVATVRVDTAGTHAGRRWPTEIELALPSVEAVDPRQRGPDERRRLGSPSAPAPRRTTSWSGTGLAGELAPALGESVRRVLVVHPRGHDGRRSGGAGVVAAQRVRDADRRRSRTARRPRRPRSRPACGAVLGRAGFTRTDAVVGRRRGSDHRPGRLRGGDLAARRAGRAPADHAARHGRRRRRRQDRASTRPRARTWSARSTRRGPCSATSRR